jgi:hypothetical protein
MQNKKLLYWLISIVLSFFSLGWFFLYRAFYINGYDGLSLPIILFILAFGIFYFLMVVEHDQKTLFVVCAMGLFGAVFLGKGALLSSFLLWVLGSSICLFAIKIAKKEQYNRIDVDIYSILRRGVPIIGTIFSILVAVGFYFSIANLQKVGDIPRFNLELPIETTRTVFKTMNIVMPTEKTSWIVAGVTVDEYFQKILRSQKISLEGTILQDITNKVDGEANIQKESGIEREIWEKERIVIEKNREMLAEKLKIDLKGNERIDEVLHVVINNRANELINGKVISSEILPIGGAFALFITIRSMVSLLNVFLFWTVSGIFSILVRLGKVKIVKEMREVDNIEI